MYLGGLFLPGGNRIRRFDAWVARREDDALGQRQGVRIVDRVGRPPHVALPGVGAGFAAAAGLLLAAEGAADLRPARPDIDVGDAAIATRGAEEGLGLAQVGGEDAGAEALRHVVGE